GYRFMYTQRVIAFHNGLVPLVNQGDSVALRETMHAVRQLYEHRLAQLAQQQQHVIEQGQAEGQMEQH
ncbi:hypothetical protein A2U01_0070969, partial [Trifolium medium]|nr:hypothetical protein [Trifolium medium]